MEQSLIDSLAGDLSGEIAWNPDYGWLRRDGNTWAGARVRVGGQVVNVPAQRVNRWMEEHGYRPLELVALRQILHQLRPRLEVSTRSLPPVG